MALHWWRVTSSEYTDTIVQVGMVSMAPDLGWTTIAARCEIEKRRIEVGRSVGGANADHDDFTAYTKERRPYSCPN